MTEEKSVLEMHDKNEEALSRLVAERKEAAKWRQIAIEERAKILCYDQDSTEEWWSDLAEKGSQGHGKEDYREQAARELEGEAHLPIAPHGIVERNENPTIEMTPERQEAFGVALERLAATATDDKYISNPWMIGRVEQAIEILREMLGGEQPRKWKNEGNSR